MLVKLIQQCIESIIYHKQVEFILECRLAQYTKVNVIYHINRLKKKKHKIISSDAKKKKRSIKFNMYS